MNNNILDIKFKPSYPCPYLYDYLRALWNDLLNEQNKIQSSHDSVKLIDIDFKYKIANEKQLTIEEYPTVNISRAEEIFNSIANIFSQCFNSVAKTLNKINENNKIQYINYKKISHFPNPVYPVKGIVDYVNKILSITKFFIENILKITDILQKLDFKSVNLSGGSGSLLDAHDKILDIKSKLKFLFDSKPIDNTVIKTHTNFNNIDELVTVLNKFKTKLETLVGDVDLKYFDINLDTTNIPTEIIKLFKGDMTNSSVHFNDPAYNINETIGKIDEKIAEYNKIIDTVNKQNIIALKSKNKFDKILNISNMNYEEMDFTFVPADDKNASISYMKTELANNEAYVKKEQPILDYLNSFSTIFEQDKTLYDNIVEMYKQLLKVTQKLNIIIEANPVHTYIISDQLSKTLAHMLSNIGNFVLGAMDDFVNVTERAIPQVYKSEELKRPLNDSIESLKNYIITLMKMEHGTFCGMQFTPEKILATKIANKNPKHAYNHDWNVGSKYYEALAKNSNAKADFIQKHTHLHEALVTYIGAICYTMQFNRYIEEFKQRKLLVFFSDIYKTNPDVNFMNIQEKIKEKKEQIENSIDSKNTRSNEIREVLKQSNTDDYDFYLLANGLNEKLLGLNKDLILNYQNLNSIRSLFKFDIRMEKIQDLIISDDILYKKWYKSGGSASKILVTETNLKPKMDTISNDHTQLATKITMLIYKLNELKEVSQDYLKNSMAILYANEEAIFYIFYLITIINEINNNSYAIPPSLSHELVKMMIEKIEKNELQYLSGSKRRMVEFSNILKKIFNTNNHETQFLSFDKSKRSYVDLLMFSHMSDI